MAAKQEGNVSVDEEADDGDEKGRSRPERILVEEINRGLDELE